MELLLPLVVVPIVMFVVAFAAVDQLQGWAASRRLKKSIRVYRASRVGRSDRRMVKNVRNVRPIPQVRDWQAERWY